MIINPEVVYINEPADVTIQALDSANRINESATNAYSIEIE